MLEQPRDHTSITPGQVYERGFVIVLVLKKRTDPPSDWVFPVDTEHLVKELKWWDVLILCTTNDLEIERRVQHWTTGMFVDQHSVRIA